MNRVGIINGVFQFNNTICSLLTAFFIALVLSREHFYDKADGYLHGARGWLKGK